VTERDAGLRGRAQVGIFRKVIEHGLVDAGNKLAIECNAEQQRDDTLRRRPDVMSDGRTVFGVGDELIPNLVVAFAVMLEGQRAVTDHQYAVNVAGRKVIEPSGHGAKPRAVDADGSGRHDPPTVGDVSRSAAACRLGRRGQGPAGNHRRQCRSETGGHRSSGEGASGRVGRRVLHQAGPDDADCRNRHLKSSTTKGNTKLRQSNPPATEAPIACDRSNSGNAPARRATCALLLRPVPGIAPMLQTTDDDLPTGQQALDAPSNG
jgi:hypothetical protein